jgi:Family of unknown function (DUF6114)
MARRAGWKSIEEDYVTSADAGHRKSGALARGWRDFRRWRRGRPFWAGFFTLLSGLQIYASTQLSFSNIQIKIGNEGFLSYVIPLVLVLCAMLIWFTPQQRIFYGVIAAAVALYSFIGVNFGGFFFGMLFGIIGGSLAVAWTPVKPVPPAEEAEEPGGSPAEAEAEADRYAQPEARVDDLFTGPLTDVLPRPVNPLNEPVGPPRDLDDTQHIPVQRGDEEQRAEEQTPEEPPPPDRDNGTGPLPRRTPRLFVITLVPLLLTAFAIAGAHGGTAARAEPTSPYPSPCPTATKSASAKPEKSTTNSASKSHTSEPEPAEVTKSPGTTPSPPAGPSPSPSSTEDGGGVIGGLIDGIGDLLGIGDESTPSASASASPTPTSPAAGGGTSTGQTPKPESSPSSAKPTKSASATPKATSSAGCVEVNAKQLAADGVPTVQKVPDQMLGSKLTLHDFAFDGITELNTADAGTIRVLQFSMTKAVTENFKLLVPGPGKHTTSLTSSALTVQQADKDGQRVKFYCSKFVGSLAEVIGLPIPIPLPSGLTTFTPDSPPPLPPSLAVPEIAFNDIDIALVFVDTDVLKAPNLNTKVLSS